MKELRLTASQRVTGVIWGLIVAGAAATTMVALSGTDIEIVNVIIVALAALGTWLLASALAALRPRRSLPDAAVTEEPAVTVAPVAEPPVTEPPATEAVATDIKTPTTKPRATKPPKTDA